MGWLHNLLNIIYDQKISTAKYKSISTNNTKETLKVDTLDLLNEWILDEVQMVSDHTVASDGARDMKTLSKKENSQLVMKYGTGD